MKLSALSSDLLVQILETTASTNRDTAFQDVLSLLSSSRRLHETYKAHELLLLSTAHRSLSGVSYEDSLSISRHDLRMTDTHDTTLPLIKRAYSTHHELSSFAAFMHTLWISYYLTNFTGRKTPLAEISSPPNSAHDVSSARYWVAECYRYAARGLPIDSVSDLSDLAPDLADERMRFDPSFDPYAAAAVVDALCEMLLPDGAVTEQIWNDVGPFITAPLNVEQLEGIISGGGREGGWRWIGRVIGVWEEGAEGWWERKRSSSAVLAVLHQLARAGVSNDE